MKVYYTHRYLVGCAYTAVALIGATGDDCTWCNTATVLLLAVVAINFANLEFFFSLNIFFLFMRTCLRAFRKTSSTGVGRRRNSTRLGNSTKCLTRSC